MLFWFLIGKAKDVLKSDPYFCNAYRVGIFDVLKRWDRANSAHGWLEWPQKYGFDKLGVY